MKGQKSAKIFPMGVLKKTRKTVLSIGKRLLRKFRQKLIPMVILTKISKKMASRLRVNVNVAATLDSTMIVNI